ncbi:lysoplasmalogenase [Lysinibacillus sp. BW-2-10]|uniref:lysoplasmalogenase n=1 Tax=Lysinibacillus sp. BW-2-10 TaxID=2590030 RepID=UPI002103CCA4|nr:lysoplasmalogenase [Lysinibacillus sp. BW-2-10]
MMVRYLLLGLIVVFSLYYCFFFDAIPDAYQMVFKLVPMFLIIVLAYVTKITESVQPYKTLIILSLIFCAIGDYTLQWFIIGLFSFLIGHIFYIRAFLSTNTKATPTWAKGILLFYGVAMMIWIGGTVFNSRDSILAFAVCAYIIVILAMGWTSFRTGSAFAIMGATLFIISDSILAINKFVVSADYSHQLIMVSYYGAQVLLALSIAKYSASRIKSDTM